MADISVLFFQGSANFGPCTQKGTLSTVQSGLCAVWTVLLALWPLQSAGKLVLLTLGT